MYQELIKAKMKSLFSHITISSCTLLLLGSGLLAFGLYQVHSFSGITEGGVLGFTLFLYHWFDISPAVSGFILNLACYAFGIKYLGEKFLVNSLIAGVSFSFFYSVFERYPLLWPFLDSKPLLAAIVGGLFVGVSVGICVRVGGAPGGDDALAMSLSHVYHANIKSVYLMMDILVLVLSLSYIPASRIVFSLITVVISGQTIGFIQNINIKITDYGS